MISDRSTKAEVRNPIIGLPSFHGLGRLSPLARAELRGVQLDIRSDAQVRAEQCWCKHKASMAAYWKPVSVYAGPIARMLR